MIAADECATNQQPYKTQQGFGTFALVDADGAISVGCPGGVGKQSVCLLYSSCDGLGDAIDRERDEGYIGLHQSGRVGAKDQNWVFGDRHMVFVVGGGWWSHAEENGRRTPYREQTAMTIAHGAPCRLLGGRTATGEYVPSRGRCSMSSSGVRGADAERTAKLRYNFETGIWSNDRGEKFKNGKLVE